MQHRDSHLVNTARAVRATGNLESLEPRTLLAATLDGAGNLSIIGTRKADLIAVVYGPDGLDTLRVRINREVFAFDIDRVESIFVQAGAGDDQVLFQALTADPQRFEVPARIYGSTGNDTIVGAGTSNRIYGGTGNDDIRAGRSRDIVYGEEGNDRIDAGQGNDFVRGGAGNDFITGGVGIDSLFGDAGRDTFFSRAQPFRNDTRPFETEDVFDLVDGGAGIDSADSDPGDRLISIESTFRS